MRPLATLIPVLLLSTAAFAADAPAPGTDITKAPAGIYELEKTHASITFKVMHMGFANYTMRFNDFDATIDLNPTDVEKSKLDVTIRPASLDANNAKMTAHTDNADFFNVEKYPTMTFRSTKIEKTSPTRGRIHGDLTLLGVTKPVVLEATFNGGGEHVYMKKYALGFSATTSITRSQFGMNYGIPSVGDTVQVAIETEFLKQ